MFDFFTKGKRRRAEGMENAARQLGMTYTAKDEYGYKSLLGDFKLFQKGTSKSIVNFLQKKETELDLEIFIFDYHYVISTGNSSVRYKQTVFFVKSSKLGLPQFSLKPEHFFHKIGTYLGMQDINFESHPEFSDQYLLKGEDEDLIRAKLDENFRNFFTIEKNWYLEGLGYFMVFYAHNKLLPPAEITNFYSKGREIYKLLNT